MRSTGPDFRAGAAVIRGLKCLLGVRQDGSREVARVFVYSQKPARYAGVEPAKPDRVKPLFAADTSVELRAPPRVKDIHVDPAIIRTEANGPEDRGDARRRAVDLGDLLLRAPEFFKWRLFWRVDAVFLDKGVNGCADAEIACIGVIKIGLKIGRNSILVPFIPLTDP